MNQSHVLVNSTTSPVTTPSREECLALAHDLNKLDTFYNSLGGILGYQLKSLNLISGENKSINEDTEYLMPTFLDLSKDGDDVREAVISGINAVPHLAEVYALGGSGDRLGLQCPESGDQLPSAMLPYCGRSMLDSMIRDLQARESLYFKLTGCQCTTPIVIMTSDAKDNDQRIKTMLASMDWYGRGKDSFFLFKQPLVPLIDTKTGNWLVSTPGKIVSRPGGHGVIWKLMLDEGVFDWLERKHVKACVVRQVSNPLAATDTTLFGLSGFGFSKNKSMGFASCERVVGASEGMNVIQHKTIKNDKDVHEYGITNIEYTEFERLGLVDVAIGRSSSKSCFPANTNILYVSLSTACKAVEKVIQNGGFGACLPGLIFNTKKSVTYRDEISGEMKECVAGRMECMMQNLADSLVDSFDSTISHSDHDLSTFMVCNTRRKVTSSAKKKYVPGGSIRQTPEGSFWDLMLNARDILTQCGMKLPKTVSLKEYLARGPGLIFLFNPSLGPLWSTIKQKIQNGSMSFGSELVLEIGEVKIESLSLSGSLFIISDNISGHLEAQSAAKTNDYSGNSSRLLYSSHVGRVELKNVRVKNKGIDWSYDGNVYWKHEVSRKELCLIHLNGCSEFEARDVTLTGNLNFNVPDGHRLELFNDSSNEDGFNTKLTKIESPTWRWEYKTSGNDVVLNYLQ
eukprot:g5647.t1